MNNEPLGDDKIPPLSKSEKAALLVSDLCDNQRISLNMLIQLQDEDANIRKFKENLVENKNTYKDLVIKNDVVCRQYTITSKSTFLLGVFIPDCILYAVMIFVHKFSYHPA